MALLNYMLAKISKVLVIGSRPMIIGQVVLLIRLIIRGALMPRRNNERLGWSICSCGQANLGGDNK